MTLLEHIEPEPETARDVEIGDMIAQAELDWERELETEQESREQRIRSKAARKEERLAPPPLAVFHRPVVHEPVFPELG